MKYKGPRTPGMRRIQDRPAKQDEQCKHLGRKLGVSKCCGQTFKCNFFKGKKCVIVGIALDPILSCETCEAFAPTEN